MKIKDKFASHLPLLELLNVLSPYNNVLEFGCGLYSTKYFVEHCKKCLSIENKDEAWYQRIKNEIKGSNIVYHYGMEAVDWFKTTTDKYDLIFVDGIVRQECISASFQRSPIIAVHDVGLMAIRRNYLAKIRKDDDYKIYVANVAYPSTSVFISDKKLIEKLDPKIFIEIRWP